jgi:hypothetical protein
MPPTSDALLKVFKQPKYTLYNDKKINQPDYNKTKLSNPFKFNDDGIFIMPAEIKKKSKK